MYVIRAVVEGIGRGLLMHRFGVEATAELENNIKKTQRKPKGPKEEAEEVVYRLERDNGQPGQLMLPAEHFLGALTNAGSSLQVKGRGKATYKKAFKGQMDVYPNYVGLTDSGGNPIREYMIDSRPVRIQASRIIRHRPHIEEWRAEFEIHINDDSIPLEVVQSALAEAGKSQCVGDYRPRFGQFRIVSFDKDDRMSIE